MTNIIFVDIDGPLLPYKMHLFAENRNSAPKAIPMFDTFAVRAFNLWAKYADAKIVFSTAWAYHFTKDELKGIMLQNGLKFNYVDDDILITPKKMSSMRHNEILWWLAEHNDDVDHWIAVDDDISCRHMEEIINSDCRTGNAITKPGRWIQVDYDNGLSWENFKDGCVGLGLDPKDIMKEQFTQDMGDSHHTGSLW